MGLKDDAAETSVAYEPNPQPATTDNNAEQPRTAHNDILSDVDALHERCEMARRIGFAKAKIREAISLLEDISGGRCGTPNAATYWAEKALRRALSMLETGKPE